VVEVQRKIDNPEWRRNRASIASRASRSVDAYLRALAKRREELTAEHARQLHDLADSVVSV